MAIKVNTAAVHHASEQVRGENRMIHDYFSNVDSAISRLSRNWKGKNGEKAVRSLRSIKSRYKDDRYQSVEQLAQFLDNTVAGYYERAETTRSAAAAEFK